MATSTSTTASVAANVMSLNVHDVMSDYVSRMATCVSGMKAILLDADTAGVLSSVVPQSVLMQREVYLFDRVGNRTRDAVPHVRAVCFLRPIDANFAALKEELRDPKFGEYHIFFNNIVGGVAELAQADEYELVREVQEFYADYYAINPYLFICNVPRMLSLAEPQLPQQIGRVSEQLLSLLLSLRLHPVIKYHSASSTAATFAQELASQVLQHADFFNFGDRGTLLLVMDRKDDPVTPLILPWTYQAMVHELIGITKNRVSLAHVPGVQEEYREITLSICQDDFFRQHLFSDYAELCEAIKTLVDDYKAHMNTNQNIQSLEDIKRFIETYPEFRQLSGNVNKHLTLASELSAQISARQLFDLSELQQDIVCESDHGNVFQRVIECLRGPYKKDDLLRLVLLYALRYEEHGKLDEVLTAMKEKFKPEEIKIVPHMLKYGGNHSRGGDLFPREKTSFLQRTKAAMARPRVVQCVFTRHQPQLFYTLDAILKGRFKDTDWLIAKTHAPQRDRYANVVVFILGGATYHEAAAVHELNNTPPPPGATPIQFLLGGNCMLNSRDFVSSVSELHFS
ncbi:vacuolar protein sorting-associated protein 45 [Pelomyxa schiedti]|nr:vacuolar protein sorting-associated protein 45 [Pelomyxa schiedti]